MSENNWVGFDLDRTLAVYDEWRGLTHIGPPVPAMVAKVQREIVVRVLGLSM